MTGCSVIFCVRLETLPELSRVLNVALAGTSPFLRTSRRPVPLSLTRTFLVWPPWRGLFAEPSLTTRGFFFLAATATTALSACCVVVTFTVPVHDCSVAGQVTGQISAPFCWS